MGYQTGRRSIQQAAALLAGVILWAPLSLGGSPFIAGASASLAVAARPHLELSAAQDPAGASQPAPPSENEIPVYLPGGDEAGPTLPSQRGIGAVRSGEGLFRLTPYIGASGIYDTGLAPLTRTETGAFPDRSAAGLELSFGVTGSRVFRRTLLNLMYRGGYSHYPNIPYLSHSNHEGALGINHSFTRRLQLHSNNTFGWMNNSFFSNFGFQGYDPSGSVIPSNEFFNTPVLFGQTTQILSYQKTARLSFSGGGGGSTYWRRSGALASVKTAMAQGNTSYRLSRRQTVGVTYMFNQFFFTNQYGGSDIHNLSIEYANDLTRTVSLALALGGARVESQSIERVEVDPIIAALFGTTGGLRASYRLSYLPTFHGALRYSKRRWSADVSGGRSVNSGNGIVLTNRTTTAGASVRYNSQRWNAGGGVHYDEMTSIKLDNTNYRSYSGDVGFSVILARGFSWANTFSVRRYGGAGSIISHTFLDRNQYRVTTGIFWSPSSFPLPLF